MKIPTPSFFKIRLVAMVISFLVMCFVIGWMKNAFAETYETSQCHYATEACLQVSGSAPTYSGWYATSTGEVIKTGYNESNQTGIKDVTVKTYYWEPTTRKWVQAGSSTLPFYVKECPRLGDYNWDGMSGAVFPTTCDDCQEKKHDLIEQCGGPDFVIWDEANCQGECGCSDEGYVYHGGECVYCPSGQLEISSGICIPYCPHGTLEKVGDIIVYDGTCVVPPCTEVETEDEYGICRNNCGTGLTLDPVTGDCKLDCAVGYHELDGECVPDCPAGTYEDEDGICRGIKPTIDPVTAPVEEPTETTPPDDKTPPPDSGGNTEDPSDARLGAIEKGIGTLIEQNNDRKNQLQEQTDKLSWIGENIKIMTDNANKFYEAMADFGNDIAAGVYEGLKGLFGGIEDDIEDVGDGIGDLNEDIDQLNDTLEGISEGSYTNPEEESEYEVPEHDFNERTTEFLTQMKSTGIFSLPDQIASSIPGGGSSILEIDTGDTFGGIHQIDFSKWSTGLLALRTVFQVMGMIIAIRIVTLKR